MKVMEIIHADEVTHVTAGHRWFTWACAQEELSGEKVDPVERFREEVRKGWTGDIKGPFNVEAREMAGLTPQFYEGLRGELGLGEKNYPGSLPGSRLNNPEEGGKEGDVAGLTTGVAAVTLEYE